jgi:SP family general alpha glucoside:H+ symporter-like MFS transporter
MVTVIIKSCGLVAVAFDAALVDKLGRRVMTLIGFGGACFGVTLMAIVGCLNYETPQLGAVLVFAGVSANFFNTIQSSTSYAYLTEMPEERFRARATGWGLAYCNLSVATVSFNMNGTDDTSDTLSCSASPYP